MGDATRLRRIESFYDSQDTEWGRKRGPFKLYKELVKRLLFFYELIGNSSWPNVVVGFGNGAIESTGLCGRHCLIISIVEFILLFVSKNSMLSRG